MKRDELIADIQRRLSRGQDVLVTGGRGIGKTWVLRQVLSQEPQAHYIPHIGSKKAVLLAILRRLWEDGHLEEFAYFADWRDVEKRLRGRTLADLRALVEPHLGDYLIVIDNLHLATEKAILEVVLPLLQGRVLAAGRTETKADQRRLSLIADRFHQVELGPLTRAEAQAMLWQLLDRSQYRHWQAIETKVLTTAQGNPGAIADLAARLRGTSGSLAEIRALSHSVAEQYRVNLLWPVGILVIAALFAGRYLARGFDDPTLYILAALAYASTYLLRPIIYHAR